MNKMLRRTLIFDGKCYTEFRNLIEGCASEEDVKGFNGQVCAYSLPGGGKAKFNLDTHVVEVTGTVEFETEKIIMDFMGEVVY